MSRKRNAKQPTWNTNFKMTAHTDLNLQKLVTDFLVHEEARVERLDGIVGASVETALAAAGLMPKHIVTDAAHYLAELISYESKEGTNPAYEHNKLQQEEAIAAKKKVVLHWARERKEGRGWSNEYIEQSFTQFVLQKLEAMSLEIQAEVDRQKKGASTAEEGR